MELPVAGIVGAAFGVSQAYVGIPRWKPLLALSQLTMMLVVLGMYLLTQPVNEPWVILAGVVTMWLTNPLVEGCLWSREPIPMTGGYWWWVGQAIIRPGTLGRMHSAHAESLQAGGLTTDDPAPAARDIA